MFRKEIEQIFREDKELEYELLKTYKPENLQSTEGNGNRQEEAEITKKINLTKVNDADYLNSVIQGDSNVWRKNKNIISKNQFVDEEVEKSDLFLYLKHCLPKQYDRLQRKNIDK